jgi:hypothetical protein
VAFTANANKVFGVNSGATSMEAKDIVTGTTGTDFNVAHTAGTITLNLPDASSSNRGVITTGNQTIAGTKTFSSGALISDGSVTGPSLGLASDQDGSGTGLYRVGANSLGFAANGVNVGQYSSTGDWTVGDPTNASFAGNNLVGRKDGSSLASGYVGEIIRVAPVSATHLSTQIANGGISIGSGATTTNYLLYKSAAVGDAVKLSLTPGVWDIDAGCEFTDSANPSTITLLQFYVGTTTTASLIGSNGDNRWVTRALKETGTSGTLVTPRVSTTITTASNQDVYLYTLFQGTVTGSWTFDGCWFVGKRIA